MTDALERFRAAAKFHGYRPPGSGDRWRMPCPAHGGKDPNLQVALGDRGVLLACHSHGCEPAAIATALGLTLSDLFDAPLERKAPGAWRTVAQYPYIGEANDLRCEVMRQEAGEALPGVKPPKRFLQRRPGPDGGWIYNLDGVRRVLFRLPRVLEAIAEERAIFVVEGEKAVLAAEALGVVATCNPGGAGNWAPKGRDVHGFSAALAGAHVVILPDHDDPGARHALEVGRSLAGIAASVRVLELPGLPPKGDIVDWQDAGGTAEQLQALLEDAAPFDEWVRAMEVRLAAPETGTPDRATDGEPAESVDLATFEDLIAGPRRVVFVVDGLLPRGSLTMVYGPSGVGKSFCTTSLSHCVSAGLPFLGRNTARSAVLYVIGEGQAGFPQRVLSWCQHEGVETPGEIRYVRHPLPLDSAESVDALLDALRRRYTPNLGLVVLDTLAANASRGFDESSTKEMGLLLDGVRRLISETGCAVLLVHHTGWMESRERGSSSLRAACEVVLALERVSRHRVKLLVQKARDFDAPDPVVFDLVPSGESLAVSLSARASALSDAQERLLRALHASPAALRSRDWQARSGVGRSTFFDMKGRLVSDGLVATNEKGFFYPTPAGLMALHESQQSTGLFSDSGWTASGSRDGSPSGSEFTHYRTPDYGLAALESE